MEEDPVWISPLPCSAPTWGVPLALEGFFPWLAEGSRLQADKGELKSLALHQVKKHKADFLSGGGISEVKGTIRAQVPPAGLWLPLVHPTPKSLVQERISKSFYAE